MAEKKKSEVWSQEDEQFFFERYSQAGNNQPCLLINQAYALFGYINSSLYDNVIELLGRYFADFPEDRENRAPALQLMGHIQIKKRLFNQALDSYKKAAEFEIEYPDVNCGAWLNYSSYILEFGKQELYDEAEKYINLYYDKLAQAGSIYQATAILASIAEARGNKEKQHYYRKCADKTLMDMTAVNNNERYVKIIKTKDTNHDLSERITVFMREKGFELGERNGDSVWFKSSFVCWHYVMSYIFHDIVIIMAYITQVEVVSDAVKERGLDGFIGVLGKWPLKKIIKQLEVMINSF